jgi:hypothetical protein
MKLTLSLCLFVVRKWGLIKDNKVKADLSFFTNTTSWGGMRGWKENFTHFEIRKFVPCGKSFERGRVGWLGGWAPEPVQTLWQCAKSLCLQKIQPWLSGLPSHRIVFVLNELSRSWLATETSANSEKNVKPCVLQISSSTERRNGKKNISSVSCDVTVLTTANCNS